VLLAHLTEQVWAGILPLNPEQLQSMLQLAALFPACRDVLSRLLGLPRLAEQLDEEGRRDVLHFVVSWLPCGVPQSAGLPLLCCHAAQHFPPWAAGPLGFDCFAVQAPLHPIRWPT